MKKINFIYIFFSLFLALSVSSQTKDDLAKKLAGHKEIEKSEKIYIQTDRPFYSPGEEVWFKVYVVNADVKPTEQSKVVFLDVLNPQGQKQQEIVMNLNQNGTWGSFVLPATGGIYSLKAHTSWMLNMGENYCGKKEIQVQNVVYREILLKTDIDKKAYSNNDKVLVDFSAKTFDGIAIANGEFKVQLLVNGKVEREFQMTTNAAGKSKFNVQLPAEDFTEAYLNISMTHKGYSASFSKNIPVNFQNIDLQFLPEGGEVAIGQPSCIAFKALSKFGKALDVAG
ncbi:MAG: hypothetical protein IAF38_06080, partial [Bacteroidia bacterium]|nr:hypothetical protein [Bacteroidia bacterium]